MDVQAISRCSMPPRVCSVIFGCRGHGCKGVWPHSQPCFDWKHSMFQKSCYLPWSWQSHKEALGSDNDVPIATIVIAVVASGIPVKSGGATHSTNRICRPEKYIHWPTRTACTATKKRGQVADQSGHHPAPVTPDNRPSPFILHVPCSTGFSGFMFRNQAVWTATKESATTKSRKPPSR